MLVKSPLPSLLDLLSWPPGQQPWTKQEEAHQRSSGERLFALFMEQRTGKTIVCLGTIAYQYSRFLAAGGFSAGPPSPSVRALLPKRLVEGRQGKKAWMTVAGRISDLPKAPSKPGFCYRPGGWATKGLDALVVIALPSGVPANWKEEVELRIPKALKPKVFLWDAQKSDSAAFAKEFVAVTAHEGLAVFLINGEALNTPDLKKALGTFLRARRALVIGDETSLICSQPGNVRAKVMNAIRGLPGSIARRILDGTPGDESVLDMYQQMLFLDWKILGFDSWTAFKSFYASWVLEEIWIKNKKTGTPEPRAVRKQAVEEGTGKKVYANLDVMAKKLAPGSFRVKRVDCFDIPAKIYTHYPFDLSAAQRAVYDPLRDEFEAELRDGTLVKASHILARMTRLDQIRANYYPPVKIPMICSACDGDGCEACDDIGAIMSKTSKKIIDPERNPLVEAFTDILSLNREPGIAWAFFDETIDALIGAGAAAGRKVVRYDGKVDEAEKLRSKAEFQGGLADLMVAKESSAGRGINLSAAKWMAYVENAYSKRKRSQSEDRAEVGGRTFGTGIIDLCAADTYDEKKRQAHINKGEVSESLWDFLRVAR